MEKFQTQTQRSQMTSYCNKYVSELPNYNDNNSDISANLSLMNSSKCGKGGAKINMSSTSPFDNTNNIRGTAMFGYYDINNNIMNEESKYKQFNSNHKKSPFESGSSDMSSLNRARLIQKSEIESLNANEANKGNDIVNLLNELNDQSDDQSYHPPSQELKSIEIKPLISKRNKNNPNISLNSKLQDSIVNVSQICSIESSFVSKGNINNISEVECQIQSIKW